MAQVQITQLPAAGAITGSELVPIVQNGVTVRTTTGAISASPSQTQTFLTLNQEPSLANSRRLSGATGIGLTDGGAQSTLTISLNGASGSLEAAGNGLIAKTASNAVTARSITVTGSGLSISNGDGVSGNPTLSLSGLAAAFANLGGTGIVAIQNGTTVGGVSILGTAGQINVANGNGVGNPTISLPTTGVSNGSYGFATAVSTFTVDAYGRLTAAGSTSIAIDASQITNGQLSVTRGGTGASTADGALTNLLPLQAGENGKVLATNGSTTYWLATGVGSVTSVDVSGGTTGLTTTGGPVTAAGVITLDGTLAVTNGGTGAVTLTGYLVGSGTSPITASATIPTTDLSGTISNAQLANSSVSFNGVSVALGSSGTITASTTSALTIGTGLQGTSFNGSTPVTIEIDSTVATLTGTQTLTNKSISGATNTLTNIPNVSLDNSSVTIGTTAIALGASSLTLGGLTSVAVTQDPTTALQLATKQYVDTLYAAGINYHAPVKYEVPVTTGNLNAIYNQPGGAGVGVGATLTNNGTLAAFAPDGPTASVGDRILVYNQTNAFENGVYTVTVVGDGSTAWVLTRSTDTDTFGLTSPNALGQGDAFFITSGNTGAGETYLCNTVGTITFGTTAITFAQISSAQIYSAGTGLSLTGTTFSIANTGVTATSYGSASSVPALTVNAQGQLTSVTNTSIAINGNQITSGTVGSSYISGSYTGITGVGTLTAGTWTADTISTAYGGTGLTSYTAGDMVYFSTGSALSKLGIGTSTYLLSSTGSAPTWTDPASVTVGNATNASSATNATNVAVTAASTNTSYYPTFVSTTTGNLGINVDADLTYNPSTNTLATGTVTATTGIFGGTF